MQFCTHCGSPVDAGSRFCTKCGNPVAAAPNHGTPYTAPQNTCRPAENQNPANYNTAKKLSTLALILMGGAILLDLIGSAIFYSGTDYFEVFFHSIPGYFITFVLAAVFPIVCKFCVMGNNARSATVLKILSIVFLSLQLLSGLICAIILFNGYAAGPLFRICNSIPASGLFRDVFLLFRNLGSLSRFFNTQVLLFIVSYIFATISNLLYVGKNVLCMLSAFQLGKS